MNANWQSVLAGISNGLMSVSVLPGRRKVLPVFLVALLPALLMAVIVVIPQCYQLRETGQRIVVLEGALDSPSQLLAAHPIGFEDAWQQVVAKFRHGIPIRPSSTGLLGWWVLALKTGCEP